MTDDPTQTPRGRSRQWQRALLACGLAMTLASAAQAHGRGASADLSALSLLPVALSVAVPAGLLSAGAAYTVKAVTLSAEGTVWVLERVSDGVQASLLFTADVAAGVSMAAGTAVSVVVVGAGWVLHSAGKAIAIIPSDSGRSLIHNEQVTR